MIILLLAAIAFSTACLTLLCIGDPKRRRSVRLTGEPQGKTIRRLLTAASPLPGLGYAVTGNAAAFLLWLGGYAVIGWFVTLAFAASPSKSA